MSSTVTIEKSLVVASLPRPVDHSTGRYFVSDVHGGTPGSRKRKRAELVVGISGEGVNLYDIQSSKLVTSYALPPQALITCAPYSLRLKQGKGLVERRTYASTTENTPRVTVFRETTTAEGHADSSSAIHIVEGSTKPVVFLGVAPEQIGSSSDNLLLVKSDGEIQCLDGEDLKFKWTSPSAAVSKNSAAPNFGHKIELVNLTDAHTASKGLLKGQPDAFSIFSEDVDASAFNPTLLVLISSPIDATGSDNRTLHVLALPRAGDSGSTNQVHSVQTLLSVAIPWLHSQPLSDFGKLQYDIHVPSGFLYELGTRSLLIYDLVDGTIKIKSQLNIDNVASFLRLCSTSVMTATNETVDIYNPIYHSIQASTNLDSIQGETASRKRKLDDADDSSSKQCELVAYSTKHNLVHAILGSQLVAFSIEARKDIPSRRRELGLLIDSVGCGRRQATDGSSGKLHRVPLSSLSSYIPGSNPAVDSTMQEQFSKLDRCVAEQDIDGFEEIMAQELKMYRRKIAPFVNGLAVTKGIKPSDGTAVPEWIWPSARSGYLEVDPRLVQYALSRVFSWSSQNGEQKLLVVFYPHNVVNWLLETGNLNKVNIETALKDEARSTEPYVVPAGQLVSSLVDTDPEMKVLLSLISNNYLDAPELVHAIRVLMQSLEILDGGTKADKPLLLTESETPASNGDMETENEIEEADAALRLAEYQLGDGASIRGQALSLALAKLHSCPSAAVVHALQSNLTSSEIVSLIYLLRFELARGAWTSKYLDVVDSIDEDTGSQDSTIVLISSLVNSCIDAIGSGGWLSGDAILAGGDRFQSEELISSLKLEVSAALEGIEEATYLKGLTSEMVRYGEAVQKALPVSAKKQKVDSSQKGGNVRKNQPITVAQVGKDATILPFGLKADQLISLIKIGAGGELQRRTARDIGRLKSKKVGKYSQERIVI
ncbi:hypothetical protein VC83_05677 [Pseudogymnoascus destructans]|uniref:Utp8 beta-propeller domain-containing protein n=2 Tax=Pseudogymnoascus destructans TaxID=655981 RepID=L8FTV8_PSED2|nr:uncharacterized protein VC83_05677 [Pseudogymnoascus destructans]ELR03126.1 hypothetical protein GMDG_05959 [Pseudogymnoascus destructans 20631-21]OAF57697.1 hypothetical protein VC83_05677 [Pseudogymnoascus destructans]